MAIVAQVNFRMTGSLVQEKYAPLTFADVSKGTMSSSTSGDSDSADDMDIQQVGRINNSFKIVNKYLF